MEYKDRNGNMIFSGNLQEEFVRMMYSNKLIEKLTPILVKPKISMIVGKFLDSHFSSKFINLFIKINRIDVSLYKEKKYKSFNDFFTRKIIPEFRPIQMESETLISPCDSKMIALKIKENSIFNIKDTSYSVYSLLRDEKLAEKYKNGYCLIFRLSVEDYHRYCYIDTLKKTNNRKIKGFYHTVHPSILKYADIYKENTREYTLMRTENFGDVVQVEVGALFVGRIKNHHQKGKFVRGEEKGMFEFGGSTIVMLFQENTIKPDEDLLLNTDEGFETAVKMGEKIGKKI